MEITKPSLRKKSFLIVDDEEDIREILKDCIKGVLPSATIVEAANGAEAQAKAMRQQFDYIISDISMPRASGVDLINSFANKRPESRPAFLIISGNFSAEKASKLPFPVDYIPKPCSLDAIKSIIEKYAGIDQQTVEKEQDNAQRSKNRLLQIISIYLEAATHVLNEKGEIKLKKEGISTQKTPDSEWDVTLLTHIEENEFFKTIAIYFSLPLFKFLCDQISKRSGSQLGIDSSEVAKETLNLIHNQAKTTLAQNDLKLSLGDSFLILGKGHSVKSLSSLQNSVSVNFSSDEGFLKIEFSGLK